MNEFTARKNEMAPLSFRFVARQLANQLAFRIAQQTVRQSLLRTRKFGLYNQWSYMMPFTLSFHFFCAAELSAERQ